MSTTTYQNLLLFLLRAKAIALKSPEAFIESLLTLPKYQIQILSIFYLDELSEEQIADRLGTSTQRVAISHASALHYLSKPLTLANTEARC